MEKKWREDSTNLFTIVNELLYLDYATTSPPQGPKCLQLCNNNKNEWQ